MNFFFYYLSLPLVLLSSILVLTSENPVHLVLFLKLETCVSNFILFISNTETLVLFFVIIYISSITIFFLFVILTVGIEIKMNSVISFFRLPLSILMVIYIIKSAIGLIISKKIHFELDRTLSQLDFLSTECRTFSLAQEALKPIKYDVQSYLLGAIFTLGVVAVAIGVLFYFFKPNGGDSSNSDVVEKVSSLYLNRNVNSELLPTPILSSDLTAVQSSKTVLESFYEGAVVGSVFETLKNSTTTKKLIEALTFPDNCLTDIELSKVELVSTKMKEIKETLEEVKEKFISYNPADDNTQKLKELLEFENQLSSFNEFLLKDFIVPWASLKKTFFTNSESIDSLNESLDKAIEFLKPVAESVSQTDSSLISSISSDIASVTGLSAYAFYKLLSFISASEKDFFIDFRNLVAEVSRYYEFLAQTELKDISSAKETAVRVVKGLGSSFYYIGKFATLPLYNGTCVDTQRLQEFVSLFKNIFFKP